MKKITFSLFLEKCNSKTPVYDISCPFLKTERTEGAGYAEDFYCIAKDNKKIAGYVEWDADMPNVPDWCPFIEKNKK